jgi:hypothetical protein
LYSNALATAPWTDFGGLQINNSTTSPDGTQNASKLQYNGSIVGAYQTVVVSAGVTYTASMYAKLDDATNICLVINNSASWNTVGGISFTTSNGLIANQWARVQFTFTAPATGQINIHIGSHSETGLTPQSVGSFFIWGCQVELSSYATSLINTTSASATRVADACFKTGISSLIGQTEGVLFADVTLTTRQSYSYILMNDSGSSANYIGIYYRATAFEIEVVTSSGLQANIVSNNSATGRFKIAIAYKANDFVLYINGTQIGTDTSGSVPTCNKLDLFYNGEQPFQINQAILFKTRLTNAELASLTTI